MKPPMGFGSNMPTEQQICDLLEEADFKVESTESIMDTSRSSNIPVEYIKSL
jgi:hypothetical protein